MVTRRTAIVGIVPNGGLGETGDGSDFPDIECSATVDLLHITRIEDITESHGRPTQIRRKPSVARSPCERSSDSRSESATLLRRRLVIFLLAA